MSSSWPVGEQSKFFLASLSMQMPLCAAVHGRHARTNTAVIHIAHTNKWPTSPWCDVHRCT